MRFAVYFAYLLGVGLPALETYRRGFEHWFVYSMTMAGDYIAGAILLIAAISWSVKKHYATALLVLAWAYVLGVMNAAFWGHLEAAIRGITFVAGNPHTETGAIIGKGIIWSICLISLFFSFRELLGKTRNLA